MRRLLVLVFAADRFPASAGGAGHRGRRPDRPPRATRCGSSSRASSPT